MKVLIVHTYYKLRGGEDLVFELESKFLSREGIDVKILAFKNRNWTFLKFFFYAFNPLSFIQMFYYLKKHKPDLVHIHNWHFAASPSVIAACRLLHVPIVHTLHNHRLISQWNNINISLNGVLKDFAPNTIIKKILALFPKIWLSICSRIYNRSGIWRGVDRYIVLTEESRELYSKSHFNAVYDKFRIKSNFVDGDDFTPGTKKDYFVFVGRLAYEKGVHVLLSAFVGTDFKLKIIGDGPLRKEVIKLVMKHPNIEYLGFRDFSFTKEVMAESLATIFPSVAPEGMPMTIIESFSCGTPVIASKFSSMQIMIKNGYNGFHFETGNIESLKQTLSIFSKMTQEEKNTISNNARQSYEDNYTPGKNIKRLISIYKEAIPKLA